MYCNIYYISPRIFKVLLCKGSLGSNFILGDSFVIEIVPLDTDLNSRNNFSLICILDPLAKIPILSHKFCKSKLVISLNRSLKISRLYVPKGLTFFTPKISSRSLIFLISGSSTGSATFPSAKIDCLSKLYSNLSCKLFCHIILFV